MRELILISTFSLFLGACKREESASRYCGFLTAEKNVYIISAKGEISGNVVKFANGASEDIGDFFINDEAIAVTVLDDKVIANTAHGLAFEIQTNDFVMYGLSGAAGSVDKKTVMLYWIETADSEITREAFEKLGVNPKISAIEDYSKRENSLVYAIVAQ